MTSVFCTIFNMSISASVLVAVVVFLRLFMKKAPKWVNVLLWGLVAIRLICPFTVESSLSLMPKNQWISVENSSTEGTLSNTLNTDAVSAHMSVGENVPSEFGELDKNEGNGVVQSTGESTAVNVQNSPASSEPQGEVQKGNNVFFILSFLWIAGVVAMLLYLSISYFCVYRRIRGAEKWGDIVYVSENVTTPFVFGIVNPRIYLPVGMDENSMYHVIAHEKAHIHRLDPVWKLMGFLLLAFHWFNPLIWVSYILLCRDIELACDERVVRKMGAVERADYSEALLACSGNRRVITACPLAFGEISVKERIKIVLNYKKPSFWLVILAVVVCAAAAVLFLTDPATSKEKEPEIITAHLNGNERTLIIEGENNSEEKKLYIKFVSTEGPEKVGFVLTCRPKVHLNLTETVGSMNMGEVISISISAKNSYTLEACTLDGKNGNVTFEISETMPKGFEGQNDIRDIVSPNVVETLSFPKLTLEDVITLSAKGHDLTWQDFQQFAHIITGSGLYIEVYEIDDTFELWIGGLSYQDSPMYIYLSVSDDLDTRIDIREGDVEAFIAEHRKSTAVMEVTDEEIKNLVARFCVWEDVVVYDTAMLSNEVKIIDGKYYHKVIGGSHDPKAFAVGEG